MRDETDEELAASAAAGDDDAFAALFGRYQTQLVRQSRPQLHGDWDAAEEIAQATWVKAHLHIRDFDPRLRPFASWLHAIRIRLVIDFNKAKKLAISHECVTELAAVNMSDEGDESDRLKLALDGLPAELSDAVKIVYLEDRSYPEAAKLLGCSVGTVHKRSTRAVEILRNLMGSRSTSPVRRTVQAQRKSRQLAAPQLPDRTEIQMLVA